MKSVKMDLRAIQPMRTAVLFFLIGCVSPGREVVAAPGETITVYPRLPMGAQGEAADKVDLKHVLFCFIDNFEPTEPNPYYQPWIDDYMAMAANHVDADGRHPIHTYTLLYNPYPSHDVDAVLNGLNIVTYEGYGEVDYHLHHGIADERQRSGAEATAEVVALTARALQIFNRHGAMLTAEEVPQVAFAFHHGMAALDNSRLDAWSFPDDPRRTHCGCNWELRVLRQLGAYADFTFPTWGVMDPDIKNSIFYVKDDENPASYKDDDNIRLVEVNVPSFGDLMIIEGPKEGGGPTQISPTQGPGTLARFDTWVAKNVHIQGQAKWIFIRINTHGLGPDTYDISADAWLPEAWDLFFGPTMDMFYHVVEDQYNDGVNWKLHYVSAREMYNIAKAAEAGLTGDPNDYRDYLIKPYANMLILTENRYSLISYSTEYTLLEVLNTAAVQEVAFTLSEFTPDAIVGESQHPVREWDDLPYASDIVVSAGEHGELHFVDQTPSKYYRVRLGLADE